PRLSTRTEIGLRQHGIRRGLASSILAGVLVLSAACSTSPNSGSSIAATATAEPSTTAAPSSPVIDEIPADARVAVGIGEPRSSGYWVIWSSCGDNNRAETAAANGGREAGWILLDDLLTFPGVTLGDHAVATCGEGVVILEASSDHDALLGLARQLLAAELNLNAGSETCPAAEETVAVAHALLSSFDYTGLDVTLLALDDDTIDSLERLIELLTAYNSGDLCR
ncbi:MAG: hypothetical protein U9R47_11150, partial [Actinomycetota bacterium]|nr:hypothetical protein [Actinomycetota bacterium]